MYYCHTCLVVSAFRLVGFWAWLPSWITPKTKNGAHYLPAWLTVFKVGIGKLDQPISLGWSTSAFSGDFGSNVENKLRSVQDVTITVTFVLAETKVTLHFKMRMKLLFENEKMKVWKRELRELSAGEDEEATSFMTHIIKQPMRQQFRSFGDSFHRRVLLFHSSLLKSNVFSCFLQQRPYQEEILRHTVAGKLLFHIHLCSQWTQHSARWPSQR